MEYIYIPAKACMGNSPPGLRQPIGQMTGWPTVITVNIGRKDDCLRTGSRDHQAFPPLLLAACGIQAPLYKVEQSIYMAWWVARARFLSAYILAPRHLPQHENGMVPNRERVERSLMLLSSKARAILRHTPSTYIHTYTAYIHTTCYTWYNSV